LGLLEHGDDLAVGKAGLLHGTSSGKGTRKFHFWRLLIGGGITGAAKLQQLPEQQQEQPLEDQWEQLPAQLQVLPQMQLGTKLGRWVGR
ncbi:hypothetical protein, partial [Xanthomonas euvesicatoria]|uniref:hypothetical protein n=1 Tax=Xanthomonas euvesicatoria TaxID=456327 RepID=UPI0032B449AC